MPDTGMRCLSNKSEETVNADHNIWLGEKYLILITVIQFMFKFAFAQIRRIGWAVKILYSAHAAILIFPLNKIQSAYWILFSTYPCNS